MRAVEEGTSKCPQRTEGPTSGEVTTAPPTPTPRHTMVGCSCQWFELTRNKQQVRGGWDNYRERGGTAWAGSQDRLDSKAHM